jgi:hypothetical protein
MLLHRVSQRTTEDHREEENKFCGAPHTLQTANCKLETGNWELEIPIRCAPGIVRL